MKQIFKYIAKGTLIFCGVVVLLTALSAMIWAFRELYLHTSNHTVFWIWLTFIVCAVLVIIADTFDVFDSHKY